MQAASSNNDEFQMVGINQNQANTNLNLAYKYTGTNGTESFPMAAISPRTNKEFHNVFNKKKPITQSQRQK